MKCEAARPLLESYLDGELERAAVDGIEAHLATCATCRTELAALERLRDVVRAARRHLAELERQLKPQSPHPDLFASPAPAPEPAQSHPALDALAELNPDELSPKDALALVYKLRGLLDQ